MKRPAQNMDEFLGREKGKSHLENELDKYHKKQFDMKHPFNWTSGVVENKQLPPECDPHKEFYCAVRNIHKEKLRSKLIEAVLFVIAFFFFVLYFIQEFV